jgi:transcriptional regulator with XRE-family HTH domain
MTGGAGKMSYNERSHEQVGYRLRLTREAKGLRQNHFARAAKITNSAYNQYERGRSCPKLENAIALCDVYDLTLDWIYLGDDSGLSRSLRNTIHALKQVRLEDVPA